MQQAFEMPSQLLIEQTTALVVAYVAYNRLPSAELPAVIYSINSALRAIHRNQEQSSGVAVRPTSTEISASIGHDRIVSFVDGKPYKSLKRHLTAHGLTPERYRARYGLPANYPMVAPSYGAQRSQIAKAIRLGQKAA
jgi:predicted transcriptional regulator